MTALIISSGTLEFAHNIVHQAWRRPLDPILSPKTIAVIGATERKRSVGRTVMTNLIEGGFTGKNFSGKAGPGREGAFVY